MALANKAIFLIAITLTSINFSLAVVDMDAITIEVENDLPKINWSTNSEMNSDYFVIERSFDSLNWAPIGTEQAAGNSGTLLNYEMIDTDFIPSGDIVYYRVVDFSYDGTNMIHVPVVSLDLTQLTVIETENNIGFELSVYPNPTSNYLHVGYEFKNGNSENYRLVIQDIAGKIIATELRSDNQKEVIISLDKMASGVYFCSLYIGNKVANKVQFIVSH